ncbi:hypothetical protein C2W62_13940 [Candidatus Entotheonella serta]|nr:hypothetical protein C2W62_13940 [Candidatus Entotheonella serta]
MIQHKGAAYSKIFRKAGLAWGHGDVAKAIAILQEGLAMATARGDTEAARIIQADLERYQKLARGEAIDLSS